MEPASSPTGDDHPHTGCLAGWRGLPRPPNSLHFHLEAYLGAHLAVGQISELASGRPTGRSAARSDYTSLAEQTLHWGQEIETEDIGKLVGCWCI